MEAPSSNRKQGRGNGAESLNDHVEWFLWRPCTGIEGICPPLAKWSDMLDGTYDIADVKLMHSVMDEKSHQFEEARNA